MTDIVNSPDVLAALRQRKRKIKRQILNSRTQMTDNVIYRGFRLFSGVASGIYSFFTPSKRRK